MVWIKKHAVNKIYVIVDMREFKVLLSICKRRLTLFFYSEREQSVYAAARLLFDRDINGAI